MSRPCTDPNYLVIRSLELDCPLRRATKEVPCFVFMHGSRSMHLDGVESRVCDINLAVAELAQCVKQIISDGFDV